MGEQGAERLANALQQNKVAQYRLVVLSCDTSPCLQTLTELNLEDNQLGVEGKRRVGRLTKKNVAVKVLL